MSVEAAETNGTEERMRLTAHDLQLASLHKRLNDVEDKQDIALMRLGELKTMIERDQAERRSFTWLEMPVWLGVLAWLALAAVTVWERLHG